MSRSKRKAEIQITPNDDTDRLDGKVSTRAAAGLDDDNNDDDDKSTEVPATATAEQIANRRIVRVRRPVHSSIDATADSTSAASTTNADATGAMTLADTPITDIATDKEPNSTELDTGISTGSPATGTTTAAAASMNRTTITTDATSSPPSSTNVFADLQLKPAAATNLTTFGSLTGFQGFASLVPKHPPSDNNNSTAAAEETTSTTGTGITTPFTGIFGSGMGFVGFGSASTLPTGPFGTTPQAWDSTASPSIQTNAAASTTTTTASPTTQPSDQDNTKNGTTTEFVFGSGFRGFATSVPGSGGGGVGGFGSNASTTAPNSNPLFFASSVLPTTATSTFTSLTPATTTTMNEGGSTLSSTIHTPAIQLPSDYVVESGEEHEIVLYEARSKAFRWAKPYPTITPIIISSSGEGGVAVTQPTSGTVANGDAPTSSLSSLRRGTPALSTAATQLLGGTTVSETPSVPPSLLLLGQSELNSLHHPAATSASACTTNEETTATGEGIKNESTTADENNNPEKQQQQQQQEDSKGGEEYKWLEVGVGPLRVLQPKVKSDHGEVDDENDQGDGNGSRSGGGAGGGFARLVQRRQTDPKDKPTKVIVNFLLGRESNVMQPAEKHVKITSLQANETITYLFKFTSQDISQEFQSIVEQAIGQSKSFFG